MTELRAFKSIRHENETGPVRAWPDMGLVLLLALALRLIGLGRFPFWEDELYSQVEGLMLWDSPLDNGIGARPLFFLLQRQFLLLFPFEPVPQRALACLFGLAGVALVWYIATRFFGRAAGLVAGLLTAAAPTQLFASQSVRYWSLIFLLMAAFLDRLAAATTNDNVKFYVQACGSIPRSSAHAPDLYNPGSCRARGLFPGRQQVRCRRFACLRRNAWKYLLIPIVLMTGCF